MYAYIIHVCIDGDIKKTQFKKRNVDFKRREWKNGGEEKKKEEKKGRKV